MKRIIITGILSTMVVCCILMAWFLHLYPSDKVNEIKYNENKSEIVKFYYSDTLQNEYLRKLRNDYHLGEITRNATSDMEKIKIILNWVNGQWEHSGMNTPEKSDAISILNEAKQGKKFRCVEYGIVCAAALNSIGYKSRVIKLKTKDVETVLLGAGHVATDVFVPQYNKWVFADGQFNAIPFLGDQPLNAVEFQNAILNNFDHLEIANMNGHFDQTDKKGYVGFVGKHLFYLDVAFDNRNGVDELLGHNGKYRLMLVPVGEKEPKRFQVFGKIDAIYTNSKFNFYQKP